jgi:hypothetical protein
MHAEVRGLQAKGCTPSKHGQVARQVINAEMMGNHMRERLKFENAPFACSSLHSFVFSIAAA